MTVKVTLTMNNGGKMSDGPFLTIGIASYNYSKYLIQAFKQIKKQEFTDYELLYCDDGSTDDSLKIIGTFIRENPQMRIRVVIGKHEGILENKNRIIDNALGQYLLICDADDYMDDNCLKNLCDVAQEQNADCVIAGFRELSKKGKILKKHIPGIDADKWLYTWHHAQIYKLSIVRENSIRFTDFPDDVCYLQQVHLYCTKTVFISQILYNWMRHSDSTSMKTEKNSAWSPEYLWENVAEFIMQFREKVASEDDIRSLNYYMYKWYYFNISDIPISHISKTIKKLKKMQLCMKNACPDYRNIASIAEVMKVKDTCFAKVAVLFCWLLEGMGICLLIPLLRNLQHKIRKI